MTNTNNIQTSIGMKEIEKIFMNLVLLGKEPDEMRIDTSRGLVEVIQVNGRVLTANLLLSLLNNNNVWNHITNEFAHISTIDMTFMTLVREGLLNGSIKFYSTTIGANSVGMSLDIKRSYKTKKYLSSTEGQYVFVEGSLILLLCTYNYALALERQFVG